MRLLVFGSSARRGATGWTDPAPVRSLLETLRPSAVGHGASPSGGADALANSIARELGVTVEPYPMDPEMDGSGGGGAFLRRNARMLATFRPQLGAGFVSGRVGQRVGTRGCYLSNGSDDMARRCVAAEVPLLIVREDGVEPDPTPLRTMRLLHALVGGLETPYQAVNAWKKGEARHDEVALVLLCAMDGSPVEPWLRAVREAVRVRRAA